MHDFGQLAKIKHIVQSQNICSDLDIFSCLSIHVGMKISSCSKFTFKSGEPGRAWLANIASAVQLIVLLLYSTTH